MGQTTNFAIPYPESTDYVTNGATAMQSLATQTDAALFTSMMGRNRLINGDFRVAQRGTTFEAGANNDDTYNLDRWYVLSDGNDVVDITQSTVSVPTGTKFSMRLDVETGNRKFGIAQIVENLNIGGMQNQTCTLSFKARTTGTSIGIVKAAILSWTGTADTVTSDVVSAWNGNGITPTWIANITAENTPVNLNVSNDWATYTISAPVDTASINNVIVFIWCDDTTTTIGDFLYVTEVELEVGSVATPFERRPIQTETMLSQRYFLALPANSVSSYNRYWNVGLSGGDQLVQYQWKTTMRIAPTFQTTGGANTHSFNYVSYNTGAVLYVLETTATTTNGIMSMGYYATNNGGSNLAVGYTSGTNNNPIWVSAEL